MQVIKVSESVISLGLHCAKTTSSNIVYYSLKIFPHLWLVKTTHIIHDNQLLLTKFGKNFLIEPMTSKWCQKCSLLQIIEPLTEKTLGQDWVVLVVRTKWQNCRGTFYSFHGETLPKNIARTARRHFDRQHLIFGVYLQTEQALNLLNCAINRGYYMATGRYDISLRVLKKYFMSESSERVKY